MTRGLVVSILLVVCLVELSSCQCPDSSWTDNRWSIFFASASANSSVTIPAGQSVLFDVSSANVYSLSIFGTLVFRTNPESYSLTTAFIRVEPSGSFIMGSKACPIPFGGKTTLTFKGTRSVANTIGNNPADGVFFGDKGLAVCNDAAGNGGTLQMYGAVSGPSWVRLNSNAPAGATSIIVDQAVSWSVGDHIVVVSTDFGPVIDYRSNDSFPSLASAGLVGRGSPDQSEEAVISSITNGGMTINLASPLKYLHWGQDYERAEVGLLTRNIVVQGNPEDNTDSYGGHIMIRNASAVAISGVEITRMGQKGILGRYPVHFHLNYEHSIGKGFVVANNSIHHNFQRCITVHSSNGIWIGNNVAYITHGHCYFLEDGAEELNVFDQNLGVSPLPIPTEGNPLPPITPADVSPGVFWIANPNNTYTGNVAVGGAFGFWFGMPVTPTGPSANIWPAATTNMRPRNLPLLKFANNVAHGNNRDGVEIDNMPDQNLVIALAGFSPLQGPYVINGTILPSYALPSVEALFENTIAYKNRNHGIWTRGGPIRHTGSKMLDNRVGFNNPPGPSLIEDSEIWGETDNVGTPRPNTYDGVRQNPSVWSDPQQIKGHETYDNGGPQYARRVKFYNFVNMDNRPAGAFGALQDGPFGHQTRNRYHSISFSDDSVVRASIPDSLNDGPHCTTIYIPDGSVIPEMPAGGWILANVTPGQIMLYPNASACVPHTDWNGWACPIFGEGYIQLSIQYPNVPSFSAASGPFTAALFNVSNTNDQYSTFGFRRAQVYPLGGSKDKYHPIAGRVLGSSPDLQFLVNVPPRNGYTMQLINGSEVPRAIKVAMTSSVGGDWMILALPFPLTAAPFTVTYTNYGSGGNNVNVLPVNNTNSLKHLTYFWDSSKGLFYIWMENVQLNSWNTNWGFNDYNYDGGVYSIIANGCPTATCGYPAATAINSIPPIPSIVYTRENTYKADLLHDCNDNNDDGATGKAWVYLNPKDRTMHFAINHNRPADVTSVKVVDTRRQNRLLVDLSATLSSPVRRVIPFSYETWTSLALGKLQVIVGYQSGQIGGNLACESASDCVLPPAIANPLVCDAVEGAAGLKTLPVFLDGPLPGWPRWTSWSWSASYDVLKTVVDDDATAEILCGNSTLGLGIQNGALVLGFPSSNQTKPPVPPFTVNTTMYPYFEFWVIPDEATPTTTLQVYFSNGSTTYGPVVASADYVLNYAIENTGWTRVRIPMSAFGVPTIFVLQSISIRQNGYQNNWAQLYLDDMVFTNGQDGGSNTAGFLASDLVMYVPEDCKALVGDGGGGIGGDGDGSASTLSSWANLLL